MSKVNYKIGFIGAGNMAQAIGMRLLEKDKAIASEIIVSAPSQHNRNEWAIRGVTTTNRNMDVVRNSDIIFIAVKPQYFEKAIKSLGDDTGCVGEFKMFVSIMAGKTINYIAEAIRKLAPNINKFEVIRIMPNTPCLVGSGCSVVCHGPETNYLFLEEVCRIMSYTGSYEIISENLFNAVAAVSGSGPAYMYLVLESLADGAVRCGVPRDLAIKLSAQMMVGAGKMVLETNKHPGELKDQVCSPGGTTIAGMHELEKGAVRSSFMNAVVAANNRGLELSGVHRD